MSLLLQKAEEYFDHLEEVLEQFQILEVRSALRYARSTATLTEAGFLSFIGKYMVPLKEFVQEIGDPETLRNNMLTVVTTLFKKSVPIDKEQIDQIEEKDLVLMAKNLKSFIRVYEQFEEWRQKTYPTGLTSLTSLKTS